MNIKIIATTLATAASLLVAACGGGGDSAADDSAAGSAVGGTAATGMAYGTVTQFGSVWVNGVEFHTGSLELPLRRSPGWRAICASAWSCAWTARSTTRRPAPSRSTTPLKGRVEQVLDASRMRVMGQTVLIDSQTRFDNGVRSGGRRHVEVHGLPVSDGTVAAGFIEKRATLASPPYAVKGFVKNHNAAARPSPWATSP